MTSLSISSRSGFTLLELAIVLVLIGLVTGGIMAGAHLVKTAEVRAVISEVEQYKTALNSFNDKYAGWPGDITNATTLWSAASPATTDGDGDGMISQAEGFRGWQQLALAEMIPGTYDGTTTVPLSRMDGGQYGLIYADGVVEEGSISWSFGLTGNMLVIYRKGSTATAGRFLGAMLPSDAASLDGKLDDGLPQNGQIRAVNSTDSPCFTTTGYNSRANNAAACAVMFKFSD